MLQRFRTNELRALFAKLFRNSYGFRDNSTQGSKRDRIVPLCVNFLIYSVMPRDPAVCINVSKTFNNIRGQGSKEESIVEPWTRCTSKLKYVSGNNFRIATCLSSVHQAGTIL
jgi:hypothetical protein